MPVVTRSQVPNLPRYLSNWWMKNSHAVPMGPKLIDSNDTNFSTLYKYLFQTSIN